MDIRYDNTIPTIGDMKIKRTIFNIPLKTKALVPALIKVAPINPPTKVCEELDGKPNHQVIRFQVIAATSAAAITVKFITSGFTTPLPIVVATCKLNTNTATKLKKAANKTALNGDKTFVETTVAIEFAES
jgi:hypothetical protein